MQSNKPKFKQLPRNARFVLNWGQDQNGNDGWILRGMDDFDVGNGMTLAHDILEHFEHKDGDASSEFEAFGCMAWGRLGADYWSNFNNTSEVMRRDATKLVGEEVGQFYVRLDGVHAAPAWAYEPFDDCEDEERMQVMLDGARKGIQDELSGYGEDKARDLFRLDDDPTPEELEKAIDEAARDVIAWVRHGFVRAAQTWGKSWTQFQFANLFYGIETTIDREFKYGDTGDALVITLDRLHGVCKLRRGYYNEADRIAYNVENEAITL